MIRLPWFVQMVFAITIVPMALLCAWELVSWCTDHGYVDCKFFTSILPFRHLSSVYIFIIVSGTSVTWEKADRVSVLGPSQARQHPTKRRGSMEIFGCG